MCVSTIESFSQFGKILKIMVKHAPPPFPPPPLPPPPSPLGPTAATTAVAQGGAGGPPQAPRRAALTPRPLGGK